jgi:hypothetical protein
MIFKEVVPAMINILVPNLGFLTIYYQFTGRISKKLVENGLFSNAKGMNQAEVQKVFLVS